MTDKTRREASSGDTDQHEKIEQGMQGADGNVDANGLDADPAKREQKLEELQDNLGSKSK